MSKSRIGMIGAGYMGFGMAKNLLEQNIEYDKSNELAKYIKLTKID